MQKKTTTFFKVNYNLKPPKQEGELPKQLGNKTECGLLGFVQHLGGNYDTIRSSNPNEKFVKVYTFNSARKMMSTIIKKSENDEFRLHTKGASEIVLERCGFIMNTNGEIEPLTQDKKKYIIRNIIEAMALDGLRTICVAYRDFAAKNKGKI
jgi:Ca2+ transporting ATPase